VVPNQWTLISFAEHTGTSLFEDTELPKQKGTVNNFNPDGSLSLSPLYVSVEPEWHCLFREYVLGWTICF
jgi:hypothetical protein